MKCLSVNQPWTDLIIDHGRPEIRKWNTKYRGRLLIHAGLKVQTAECKRLGLAPGTIGAILGMVELIDTELLIEERWQELQHQTLEAGKRCYGESTFAWFFGSHVRFLKPIPFKGKLGLFDVSDDTIRKHVVQ
jgi:hypothetical protein